MGHDHAPLPAKPGDNFIGSHWIFLIGGMLEHGLPELFGKDYGKKHRLNAIPEE